MTKSIKFLLASAASCAFLVACGGGGGGGSSSSGGTVTPPVSNTPTYTPGTFAPATSFKDQCQTPRAGRADVAGSTLIEKFWLRSWTDETYLWYSEVPDLDPNSIADRVDYFDELRTNRTTASGALVDQFHFSQDTAEYEARQSGEASSGYGASLRVLQGSPPGRDIRIAYNEPGSPAAAPGGFQRGDKILVVDGIDAVNGATAQADLDVLLAGLFPSEAGEEHSFTVEGVDGIERDITITSADVVEQPVTTTSIIDVDDDTKVGYIHFTTFSPFSSEKAIFDAMTEMEAADIDDLVLDLRYNGGGLLAVAAQIGFMVAGDDATDGKTFDRLTFNDKNPNTNPVTGGALQPTPFISTGVGFTVNDGTPLPELDLERIFILSTDGTCSASEAVINGLRGIDVEVILVGSQTCGKPYGFYPTDNCGETYFTVQFRGANDKGFGDYADGFLPNDGPNGFGVTVPGCTIADNFEGTLGDENEPFLAAALQFAENGTCPDTVSTKPVLSKSQVSLFPEADILNDPRYKMDEFMRTSRILGVTDGDIEDLK
jgi:hypothetical protein